MCPGAVSESLVASHPLTFWRARRQANKQNVFASPSFAGSFIPRQSYKSTHMDTHIAIVLARRVNKLTTYLTSVQWEWRERERVRIKLPQVDESMEGKSECSSL